MSIELRFLMELGKYQHKPYKLNEDKFFADIGDKYLILGYSPRPGFHGDFYVIYCMRKNEDKIVMAFYSNYKIAQKITEYRMNLKEEIPICKKRDKELFKMEFPIEFTLGEIKKETIGIKKIKYREIFFK